MSLTYLVVDVLGRCSSGVEDGVVVAVIDDENSAGTKNLLEVGNRRRVVSTVAVTAAMRKRNFKFSGPSGPMKSVVQSADYGCVLWHTCTCISTGTPCLIDRV